jgi:predicted nucleic acid-binding protein
LKVFIDTNVLLDVLARRDPHYAAAAHVWTLCEQGKIEGYVSAISFNNVFYIVRRLTGRRAAHRSLGLLRDVFRPVTLDSQILNQSIASGFADFEDAIQYHSALRVDAVAIVTRDAAHFPKSEIAVVSPAGFVAAFATGGKPGAR